AAWVFDRAGTQDERRVGTRHEQSVCRAHGLGARAHSFPAWSAICSAGPQRRTTMLWTIAVILAVLWMVGLVSSYTMGGFIHFLLILAVISVVVQLIRGRRA